MPVERSNTINAPDFKICLECNRQFTGIVAACPHDGTLLVQIQQDPLIGSVLAGCYEIESVIGHGGMGVVYRARHSLMDRIVAIKMLKAQLVSDSMSVKRFQQEVKACSRINHPNVITVFDFGVSPNGLPYIVMDYLEGVTLANVITNEGQVAVERGIKILSQACEALAYAHKQGVVHRDLKPTNIVLINYDGDRDFVKVVDFGVAKLMTGSTDAQRLTQAGDVTGSPVYMSPEQCMGQDLDLRSDIYSMGIVIYETLTGQLPLVGKTMVETMSKHVGEMPQPFSVVRPDLYIPERIEQVIMKAMAKDANARQQSMEELRDDMEMAIPRPGRSAVLRKEMPTAPSAQPLAKTLAGGISKNTIILVAVFSAILVAGAVTLVSVGRSGLFQKEKPVAPSIQANITQPKTETPPVNQNAAVQTQAKPPSSAPSATALSTPTTSSTASTPSTTSATSSDANVQTQHPAKAIVSEVRHSEIQQKPREMPKTPRPRPVVAKIAAPVKSTTGLKHTEKSKIDDLKKLLPSY